MAWGGVGWGGVGGCLVDARMHGAHQCASALATRSPPPLPSTDRTQGMTYCSCDRRTLTIGVVQPSDSHALARVEANSDNQPEPSRSRLQAGLRAILSGQRFVVAAREKRS